MKKVIVLLTIFLFFSASAVVPSISKEAHSPNISSLEKQFDILHPISRIKNTVNDKFQNYKGKIYNLWLGNVVDGFVFSPKDIELEDDAFHRSDTLHFTEWWYFDALLNDGYSIQISIQVFSIINQGFVCANLNVYQNDELKASEKKLCNLLDFYASTDVPFIKLNRKQVMKGYIDDTTGDWIYDLSLEIDEVSAKLRFVGCTKGWKGITPISEWGVILPRAEVNGHIKIKNKEINVNGIGYHDHNWGVTIFAGMNFGWIWGKVNSNNYTVTWSTILTTRFWNNPLLVINKKNDDYMNIEPDKIHFVAEDFRMKNGMFIPNSFIINANDEYVSFHINIEILETHHVRVMGMINYWRYHVRCMGSITVDSKTETIDEIQIAEFIRFR